MKKTDTCHPLPLLLFFLAAVLFSVLYMHPVPAALSLIGGACFLSLYQPVPLRETPFYLLLFLTVCLGNPIFVPRGRTVLFFLFNIPITIESLVAGAVNGMLLLSVLLWCRAMFYALQGDRLLYLLGKRAPKTALILSMTLRFIPMLTRRFREIRSAQRGCGGTGVGKIRSAALYFGALVSCALEDSVTAGISMECRGGDLPGRSFYAPYVFTRRDKWITGILLLLILGILSLTVLGAGSFRFYPTLSGIGDARLASPFYILYGFFMLLPSLWELWGRIVYARSVSRAFPSEKEVLS